MKSYPSTLLKNACTVCILRNGFLCDVAGLADCVCQTRNITCSCVPLTTSPDGGTTWTTLIHVNDDPLRNGANQFQPQMVVAPDGVISISFFDTRVVPQHRLIDVFLAQSTNKGASFLKNVRVTTQSWDPAVDAPIDGSGQQFIGDYQGLAADNHFVHPFWNDTRTGKQEIFMVAVPSART